MSATPKREKDFRLLLSDGVEALSLLKISSTSIGYVLSRLRVDLGLGPLRFEHMTYPRDGRVHSTLERLERWRDEFGDPDPLKLQDAKGRQWHHAGPALDKFSGAHRLTSGCVFLSADARANLEKKAPRDHDVVFDLRRLTASNRVLQYNLDLVEPTDDVLTKCMRDREQEAASINKRFEFHVVKVLGSPNWLVTLMYESA